MNGLVKNENSGKRAHKTLGIIPEHPTSEYPLRTERIGFKKSKKLCSSDGNYVPS